MKDPPFGMPIHESSNTKDNKAAEVVGRRIKVFWPQEGTWFEGSISRYDQDKGKHRVCYDDGDKEWVVLSAEQYELLPDKAV
ncbi:DNA mismatch repair protein [Haematococcus lacustris]|uniref:DNA mismatch repair protein n=1 Tax=Haematococcus lacustris TaxID=44745 RepID=A0A699YUQ4_HAELA|nr:DNA mismatch repair protein [Haematococcus lacustris]